MSSELSRLAVPAGARHKERRVGRGTGSNVGKTCGRGVKGQKARHGGNVGKLGFQGGQTPLQRRLPKRGFRSPIAHLTVSLNVSELERFAAGSVVDEQALRDARLVQARGVRVKILGEGELTKKLTVHAYRFSAGAVEKIEKAGGKAVLLEAASERAEA
jgi:large subunit ribosomal protein L15